VTSPLHCSESFCDTHDYQINTSGICLRQDALRRSQNTPRLGSNNADLAEAMYRLGDILQRMEGERQPNWSPPPSAPQPKREQRKGGTPL